jgi:hypothetical protein
VQLLGGEERPVEKVLLSHRETQLDEHGDPELGEFADSQRLRIAYILYFGCGRIFP